MATSVFHVQPIERKPFYHVFPGKSALTLAAPGCTFSCSYCQNFTISQFGRIEDAPWSAKPVSADDVIQKASETDSLIAFSYTEPILAAELCLDIASRVRDSGAGCVWKTNAFLTPAAAKTLAPALLAVNVDLKAATEAAHEKLTAAPLAPVLEALSIWKSLGVWIEISTPLIPGINDDEASLRVMARHIHALGPETPWHLLRFHPDYRLQHLDPTHPTKLRRAREIALEQGLYYVYVERALGEEGRATACFGCQTTLIKREIGALSENRILRGKCPQCSRTVEGVFEREAK